MLFLLMNAGSGKKISCLRFQNYCGKNILLSITKKAQHYLNLWFGVFQISPYPCRSSETLIRALIFYIPQFYTDQTHAINLGNAEHHVFHQLDLRLSFCLGKVNSPYATGWLLIGCQTRQVLCSWKEDRSSWRSVQSASVGLITAILQIIWTETTCMLAVGENMVTYTFMSLRLTINWKVCVYDIICTNVFWNEVIARLLFRRRNSRINGIN